MISQIEVVDYRVGYMLREQLWEIPGINSVLLSSLSHTVRVSISHELTDEEVIIIAEELKAGIEV